MGLLDNLFESESARKARIEQEKFDVQIKTDMKVRALEKLIAQNEKEAEDYLGKAERYRAAGNKDAAMDAYQDYLFARSLRKTVNKSVRMMKQVTIMVKTGNLTNDVFTLLKSGMETSQFEPGAIQKVIAGNEKLKAAFEAVGDTMETYFDNGLDEASAQAWFESGSTVPTAPQSTNDLDAMAAALDAAKKSNN